MILYLDASALVKLYVNETDSDKIRGAVQDSRSVFCHLITYAEVRAGLAKAKRMGRVADDEYQYQIQRFERDWKNLEAVLVESTLVRRAGALAEQFVLRGYDSVHLAAAERVFDTGGRGGFTFAAFDKALCAGAQALGMSVLS